MTGYEKLDKYLDLARELKKFCIMEMTMIQIMVWALETVLKNLKKRLDKLEIRRPIEIIGAFDFVNENMKSYFSDTYRK